MARSTLLVFGVMTASGTIGINISSMVAGLGPTGFARVYDKVHNIQFHSRLPYRHSDHIPLLWLEEIVSEIDLRYITHQFEGKRIFIPNYNLFTNTITAQDNEK
jgi:small conductance mechanosensitive channel